MATTVQEFGPSEVKTTFYGSSKDDMIYAKTFWQSVQLLPPMESRLVSSDVKQRLKKAPAGNQPVNLTYPQYEEPPVLTEFLANAKIMQKAEEIQKLEKFSALRKEDQALLEKHRQIRIEKEKPSRNKVVNPGPQAGDYRCLSDEDDIDAVDALRDIDEFETKKHLKADTASDSD